jgi:gamma-tubulin complex component 2
VADVIEQAYSRLIVTCATFALYTTSFSKSANQAISAAETEDGDRGMAKRWDILGKFETNFNHWYVLASADSVHRLTTPFL